jgi:hypothetical protein
MQAAKSITRILICIPGRGATANANGCAFQSAISAKDKVYVVVHFSLDCAGVSFVRPMGLFMISSRDCDRKCPPALLLCLDFSLCRLISQRTDTFWKDNAELHLSSSCGVMLTRKTVFDCGKSQWDIAAMACSHDHEICSLIHQWTCCAAASMRSELIPEIKLHT